MKTINVDKIPAMIKSAREQGNVTELEIVRDCLFQAGVPLKVNKAEGSMICRLLPNGQIAKDIKFARPVRIR
jgi:hypothetical protein